MNNFEHVSLSKKTFSKQLVIVFFNESIFLKNWDSLHARLTSHYEAYRYKKKKHKQITEDRKSV